MEIFNDNCLEKMKDLSNNSIDLLFCDLPYGQTSCKWDCLIDLDLFWKEVNRICKDDAAMFFTCSTKFGVSLINSNPKHFRYDLVWVKSAACGFLNAKKMPMKKHEMVYVFYKKLPKVYSDSVAEHHTHKFIKDRTIVKDDTFIRGKETTSKNEDVYNSNERMKNGKLYHHARSKQKGDEPIYDPPLPTSVIKYDQEHNSDLYGDIKRDDRKNKIVYNPPLPNSILEIKSEKGKHATQKPVDLIKWCLKYYSKEGDVILDPTMGSGSTGIACKEMNRKFVGIEMNEDIFEVAKLRLGL
jgi:DNA modification methylase